MAVYWSDSCTRPLLRRHLKFMIREPKDIPYLLTYPKCCVLPYDIPWWSHLTLKCHELLEWSRLSDRGTIHWRRRPRANTIWLIDFTTISKYMQTQLRMHNATMEKRTHLKLTNKRPTGPTLGRRYPITRPVLRRHDISLLYQNSERPILPRIRSGSIDQRTVIVSNVWAIADWEDIQWVRNEVLIWAVECQTPEAIERGDDWGLPGKCEEIGLVGR